MQTIFKAVVITYGSAEIVATRGYFSFRAQATFGQYNTGECKRVVRVFIQIIIAITDEGVGHLTIRHRLV